MPLLIIVISTFVVIAVLGYLVLSRIAPRKTLVDQRLDELSGRRKQIETDPAIDRASQSESPLYRTVGAISSAVPVRPKSQSKYRLLLTHAGYRNKGALALFLGTKLILAAAGFWLMFLLGMAYRHDARAAVILGVCGLVIGLIAPNVWLSEKVKRRKLDIFHSLPDVLDLMTVCVEAGLGLDASIIKISEEKHFAKRHLAHEFRQVSQEIRAGKPRLDALKDMGERTGVDDVKALTAMLIQTEKLGASLSRSLRVHSDTLRTKRRQMAEEAAAKTPIKLLFPLAFFIFPALLVVLLGPAVIKIFTVLFGKTL